ncbi:MAG TPA: molybdopterin-dependent oxidoreductase [Smithellaceae bacterium]|jgi:anaerobic selenocysteine-containing dehydrogenase|nr:molybdopterin-dependent oxidoreductase [Smithellaceae bacterium]HOH57255.1 molybdopterin-dependent oxidoreductase [Smithellaceae bacterium]HPB15513.1 molybdopterin-dependent oxidoreductase [Smithellaceae bacterium]HPI51994.1 molybdopterin-dependent oxidoreductase [Smithellaceae bacterium]HPV71908.1 molybdopterin-dependent oxidoreductase [Smithellaceae bacterium]
MGKIFKTGCVLCAQNCGLEIEVENNRIVKVRGDKSNAKSEGYICRKGLNVAYHQHNADRLKYPLKKVRDKFERISWDQAIDEIATKLKGIIDEYGPRSFAYMGGGGQGCHFEAAFGVRLMRSLGSQYQYSALAQEFSGAFWVCGRTHGKQYLHDQPDVDNTDVLLIFGWNGMQSHQIPQAPRKLQRLSKDKDKMLIVVDPRKTETAKLADIHLPIRPGTDALLLKAMISLILKEGWENKAYLADHTSGFDSVKSCFENFDARAAVKTCSLDFEQVREVTRLYATRKSSLRYDLGLFMGRHSALNSYLIVILQAICGRLCSPGGNVINGHLMPIGPHTDERDSKIWRTMATNSFPVCGSFPPNVMPEEILSDHPERLRAVIVTQSNPLRSYADTTAYEKAFQRLDLLVTGEVAMTETAALSHYVLPSRTGYESWDGTFFPMTYPGIYFQMRRPILEPEGEPLELGEVHLRLADKLGLIPPIPESLYQAAFADRATFGKALMEYAMTEPKALKAMPFILGKTLGKSLGSVHLAALWGMLLAAPKSLYKNAVRAGFTSGPGLGEELFQQILDHPEGIWAGKIDPENNFAEVKTEDGRIHLFIPELIDELNTVEAAREEAALRLPADFPLILMAGRHTDKNANTLMRDPAWNEGKRACTLAMHPEDAAALNLKDTEQVRVITEAGTEEIELEVTDTAHKGHVVIPHGFGMIYNGVKYGANVNRLTKNTHRDQFGTPIHRYVPCRVEAI